MTVTITTKGVYLQTFGCQMNQRDSEIMLGLLGRAGYSAVESPQEADLVLFNTCHIRENAVNRFYGHLGALKALKQQRPGMIIGVAGCIAQEARDGIRQRAPFVDLVFGTQNYFDLPQLVAQVEQERRPLVAVADQMPDLLPEDLPALRKSKLHAWINVIYGCNYRCTYCIVPTTRGEYRSRLPEAIVQEVEGLAREGYREVTLLGQTVDAYGLDLRPRGTLGSLLRRLDAVAGLERIRFLTSHPTLMTDELIRAVAELPKVCETIHIPLQAGDDEVLKRMRRGYTLAQYTRVVARIRDLMPGAAITGDLIVGFPGETEAQFMKTVEAVYALEFDTCNTAVYSPRPGTEGATYPDPTPLLEKQDRLQYLNRVIHDVALRKNRALVGREVEVLFDEACADESGKYSGRTRTNKIAYVHSDTDLVGQTAMVAVQDVTAWSLRGAVVLED